jgi:hypothetical protein
LHGTLKLLINTQFHKTPMFGRKKTQTKSWTQSLRLLYSLYHYGELGGGILLSSVHYLCWS